MPNTSPPRIAIPRSFSFPAYKEAVLFNGIKIIVVEDASQPLMSLSVVFREGATLESVWGAASFTASLCTKGTHTRSAQDIADDIDYTGGSLTVSSGWDSASAYLNILAEFAPKGIELLADVLLHPAFATEEIERLRKQTLVGIQHNLEDAGYLSSIVLNHGLYGSEIYGHPLSGTLESVGTLTQEHCAEVYAAMMRPEACFIAAAGNITLEELTAHAEQYFGAWQAAGRKSTTHTERARHNASRIMPPKGRSVLLTEKPDAAQTSLRVGFHTVGRQDSDYIALQFLNNIFGGTFISRLNKNLREEKGYTYGVHSSIDARRYANVLSVGTHVGTQVAGDALQEILREIERLRTEPITDDELETTRKYLLGSFALKTETPNQVVSMLSTLELYDLPKNYHEQYFAKIATLTKEQLFEVQQRRFHTDDIVIAASGNVEQLQKILCNFGELRVVEAK